MNLAQSFLDSAKNHLIDSKILYSNKRYPSAIFHFQQSVEIISKSFGLVNSLIEPENLKSVSHSPHKIFRKPIEKHHEEIKEAIELEKIFPDFFVVNDEPIEVAKYEKEFSENKKSFIHLNPNDFEFIEEEDIGLMIRQLEELSDGLKFDTNEVKKEIPKLYTQLSERIKKINPEASANLNNVMNDEKGAKIVSGISIFYISRLNEAIYYYNTFFWFSLFTSAHNQDTRYPCVCCGEIPDGNYTVEHPLIIKFEEMTRVLEKAISYFECLYFKPIIELEALIES